MLFDKAESFRKHAKLSLRKMATKVIRKGLMDLPTEIRLQIFREVFASRRLFASKSTHLWDRRFYLSALPNLRKSAILHVNRRIRLEGLVVMFGDPLWRVATDRHDWGIYQNDIKTLRHLQQTNELSLIRRFRFEFDLDQGADLSVSNVQGLICRVNSAGSVMATCCDLLEQAAVLDVEIAWVDQVDFSTWNATQAMLQPLSCLKNIRSMTITRLWKRPESIYATNCPRTRYLGPTYQEFADHLKALTGVMPTWHE